MWQILWVFNKKLQIRFLCKLTRIKQNVCTWAKVYSHLHLSPILKCLHTKTPIPGQTGPPRSRGGKKWEWRESLRLGVLIASVKKQACRNGYPANSWLWVGSKSPMSRASVPSTLCVSLSILTGINCSAPKILRIFCWILGCLQEKKNMQRN